VSRRTAPTRSLRANPNLDQLRRQAKKLLSAFRAGDADAVADVTAHYRDADATTFALHDAQLVLARAYGFDSWPKLKASVDRATVSRLSDAVRAGDTGGVTALLEARPEIINMEGPGGDEQRPLHHAVLARDAGMVRLLMAHGADARVGINPHRVPTTAMAIATERGYDEIVAIIRDAEAQRPGGGRAIYANDAPALPALDDAIQRAHGGAAINALESSGNPALVTSSDQNGVTLLHLAAARLLPDLAAWLLDHGADANTRSAYGFAPMDMLGRWPATHPHVGLKEVAALLIQHGAEQTAFGAVASGDAEWLRARQSEGTLVNQVGDGGGLVTFAVRLDRPEMLTLLLDLGFDPDERPDPARSGGRPLEWCAREQRFKMAETLLARGATLTAPLAVALGRADWIRARHAEGRLTHPAEGDGLLTVAVEHDRGDMLRLLLDLGFDPSERKRVVDDDGVHESRGNPLARCAGKSSLALAEILLAHGADANAHPFPSPMAMAYRNRDRAMLELLSKHGGVVSAGTAANHRDVAVARQRIQEEDESRLPPGGVVSGQTVAEELLGGDCGEPEIIRMALARVDWPPDDPRWYERLRGPLSFWNHVPWIKSPLWDLDRDGYLACFRLILARSHANHRAGSSGRTILHDVMAMGHHDGVSGWITEDEALAFAVTLLDAGARTDVRDDLLQSTPLGWACRWGRTKIVRELLDRGVDPVEPDAQPWATPYAWAQKMGHREIVQMLGQQR
jgi:ankyrin repeat protein